jgi:uncharacterized protein YabE (DUF348 family)
VRRSAKLTLYSLVVAGLVAGTLSATSPDRTVTLAVDEQSRQVRTSADTVGGVLDSAGVDVGEHDVIAPGRATRIHSGDTIVVRHGRLLHLTVDGVRHDVWTTAATVDEALAALGYGSGQPVGVSRSQRLPLSPTSVDLVLPKLVTIRADHKVHTVWTTAATVHDVVAGAHLGLQSTDRLAPAGTTRPTTGMTITLTRVRLKAVTTTVTVRYSTTSTKDPSQYRGYTEVVRAGKNGSARVRVQLVYVNGKLSERRELARTVLTKPVTRVVKVGTKAPVGNDPAAAQALARTMVADRGWDSSQFQCLVSLWNKESHWNVHAANPSGAYGIPQALPGVKMASAGSDWQNSAATQIRWGLGYIASRYGTPCAAWSHSQATNWY